MLTGMWGPSKRFGEIVTGIENTRKMPYDKIFLFAPFLDGKMLDVKMPSTESGAFLIVHMESSHVVNEQMCQAKLKSIKCHENAAKILGDLPTSHR